MATPSMVQEPALISASMARVFGVLDGVRDVVHRLARLGCESTEVRREHQALEAVRSASA